MDAEPARPHRVARALGRLAGALVLAVAAYLGGVGVTALWPAQAETPNYRAAVSLRPLPTSTVSASTVLGDVSVHFDGPVPAPDIVVSPQVKRELTDVFARQGVSVDTIRPTEAQTRAAAEQALIGLAWRFALGVVLTVIVVLALLRAGGRLSRRTLVQVGAVATTLALVLPTLAAWQTYRASNVGAIRATSLLGMVRSNAGTLSDVRNRSEQVSRYVVNALALTQALEGSLTPPEASSPAVRILLVSDIHGANQFPILRRIVQEERIDAVIDAGDLINFGRVVEADSGGLLGSIASLGVPYVFVRGNHDATGPGDEALLRRLAQVPNVVLLEPTRGQYQQLDLGGLRIGGFNDPRYYGDSDNGDQGVQKDRQRSFLSAYGGEPPDVVVSHEPAAVDGIKGSSRLLLNGHVHTPGRNGRRVSIGTLTGGGIFGTRIAQGAEGGTEQVTSTYYFDVAQFGRNCGLVSLTRYAFKDIVEGRPAYQDLSVINGRSILEPPEGRTCVAGAPPRRLPAG